MCAIKLRRRLLPLGARASLQYLVYSIYTHDSITRKELQTTRVPIGDYGGYGYTHNCPEMFGYVDLDSSTRFQSAVNAKEYEYGSL